MAPPSPVRVRDTPRISLLVALLIGLGSAALGAALVAVLSLVIGGTGSINILDGTGELLPIVPQQGGSPLASGAVETAPDPSIQEVVVDVAGAVVRPGLHRLTVGDRVGDAIEAAGGFAPRVDLAEAGLALNLAEPLSDGDKVLVPEMGIERPRSRAIDDGLIDINAADQTSLETLPGIGPVTARKITAARATDRFDDVKDLRSRGLVGDSVYGQIKDLVRVGR